MKPTAKQVAHEANVSLSAVSRAFMPGAPLDEEKKRRILAAAARLGYVSPARRTADAIAAGTISLVTGDLSNPFYPLVLETLAKRLQVLGQQLLVYALPRDSTVDSAIDQILAARPRAVIITSAHLTSGMAAACRRHGIKVVLLNRVQHEVRADAVTCDNYGGGRDVAEFLLARGRSRIGFLGGVAGTSTHVERARGFRDRLDEAGKAMFREACGAFDYGIAYKATMALLEGPRYPDALFCCNDIMALAAIDAARKKGMSIADDLAIIGFDDIPMAAWNSYNLTTIQQPVERMVHETLTLIDDPFGHDDASGALRILPGKMVVRASA